MRLSFPFSKTVLIISVFSAAVVIACNSSDNTAATTETNDNSKTDAQDPVSRGQYLVTVAGCNDCHSPKIMTAMGPVFDSTKLLSGHPAGSPLPPIAKTDWILMAPDITAFVGPWGISYTANLTSDSATGIGAWPEQSFINAIRTGKHLGNPNDRDILPPMPWNIIREMTDADLKAVYAYLQSLPPINNKVPAPVAPPDVAKMMTTK
jgi:cytochrome c553